MQKKKILYVVFELFAGGMENGIINLINNSSDNFINIICCLRSKGVFAKRLKGEVKFYELNMRYGNDFSLPFKLYKIIKNETIDLVRAFNEDPYFYSFAPAKLLKVPIIYYHGGRTFPEIKRRLLLEKYLANFATKVVVPSSDLGKYMVNTVGIHRKLITVIHNGVDIKRFDKKFDVNKKKLEIYIPLNNLVIGTVGRLTEQKDIPTFLSIAQKLLQAREDISFIIVGDGHLKEELLALASKMAIAKNVKFLGIRNDVDELFRVIDIFLLTSRWEGMSNVLLEAMACKKSILSTKVEGVAQIINNDEEGLICNVGDVDEFTKKILKLNSKKRKELGEKAYKKVEEKFSMTKMIKSYEDLYYELL
jgi:glycosyltransferase involved in cell wall biosynthesis